MDKFFDALSAVPNKNIWTLKFTYTWIPKININSRFNLNSNLKVTIIVPFRAKLSTLFVVSHVLPTANSTSHAGTSFEPSPTCPASTSTTRPLCRKTWSTAGRFRRTQDTSFAIRRPGHKFIKIRLKMNDGQNGQKLSRKFVDFTRKWP